jgi:hypothetical protein
MSFGQFQIRRGTAALWTSTNPTLLSGEFGLETDTLAVKLGDGVTAWVSLGYYSTKIRTGSGAPSGSLGVIGDLYIDSTAGNLYLKTATSTWTLEGSLLGPTGPTGSTGPPGTNGTNGVINTLNTTAPLTGGGSASTLTLAISAATSSAAGSMSANEHKKLLLYIYDVVADYGADPTGTTNSATNIQNAINAAQAAGYAGGSGAIVWFPPGRYLIGTTLIVTGHNITLYGCGSGGSLDFGNYYAAMGSTIVPNGAFKAVQVLPVQTNGLSGVPNNGFKWRGIAIDCYANAGTIGLQLLSCTDFDIDDFYSINATDCGLDFNTLSGATTVGSHVWTTNVAPTTINVNSVAANGSGPAFTSPSGTIVVLDGGGTKRAVTYTGISGSSFTGCLVVGGVATAGTVTAGSPVQVLPGAQDCTRGRVGQVNFRAVDGGGASGMAIRLNGDGGGLGNANLINFVGPIKISHNTGIALKDINSDSNYFNFMIINRAGGGTGIGAEIGAGASVAGASRNNVFNHVSFGPGGLTCRGTPTNTFGSGPTYVQAYQLANGEPAATIEAGAQAFIQYNGALTPGMKNISLTAQAFSASALTLVVGSAIMVPPQGFQVGTTFRWRVPISKTAAGTAGRVLSIRVGTTGTTADAIVQTWAAGTATAAIDSGWMEVIYTISAIGASANGFATMQLCHAGATTPLTGLDNRSNPIVIGGASAFNSLSSTYLFISLSLTTGASAVETCTNATAYVERASA